MIQVTLAITEFMLMLIWAGAKVVGWFGAIALGGLATAGAAGYCGRRIRSRLASRRAGK